MIKANKVGLRDLAKTLGNFNFSQVCRVLGDSRDSFCSFYRLRDLSVRGGAQAVAAISKAKPNLKIDRVASEMETDDAAIATAQPAWGQAKAANELRQRGIEICRQAASDTFAKFGFAKVCHRKTALAAADGLNDCVAPFSKATACASTAY